MDRLLLGSMQHFFQKNQNYSPVVFEYKEWGGGSLSVLSLSFLEFSGIGQCFWDKTDIISDKTDKTDKTDKKDKDKTDKKSDNIPDKFSCQVQTMFISYKVIDYR